MLRVLLPLLPDRRVGGDDPPAFIRLGIGEQRLHDEIARTLVHLAAIGGGLEQRWIVILAEIFTQRPEHFAPIVEFDVRAPLLGEEGLFFAIAEVAHYRDLIV